MAGQFDPYETLGVDRNAGAEEIKKAHRRRARETHPDVGGDAEAFHQVSAALAILSDPTRRRRFDETGDTESPTPDSKMSKAMGLVAAAVNDMLADDAAIYAHDLVCLVQNHFRRDMDGIHGRISELTKVIRRAEALTRRFKAIDTSKPDVVRDALRARIRDAKLSIERFEEEAAVRSMAIEIIGNYEFYAEMAAGDPFNSATNGSWTIHVS